MRAYTFVVLLLLLIFGSVAGYLYNKFSTLDGMDFTPPPITIAAATAQSAVWPSRLEAVGTIRATRGVELSAETSGEIIAIEVRSGEQVAVGQAILTLNDSVERASLRRQEANLTLARLLFERDASLVKKNPYPRANTTTLRPIWTAPSHSSQKRMPDWPTSASWRHLPAPLAS